MTNPETAVLTNSFGYHKPDEELSKSLSTMRGEFLKLANVVVATCPHSRERALAITKLEEASMWAVKSCVLTAPLVGL